MSLGHHFQNGLGKRIGKMKGDEVETRVLLPVWQIAAAANMHLAITRLRCTKECGSSIGWRGFAFVGHEEDCITESERAGQEARGTAGWEAGGTSQSVIRGFVYAPAFFSILAQVSFSASVRLKILLVSDESGSTQK